MHDLLEKGCKLRAISKHCYGFLLKEIYVIKWLIVAFTFSGVTVKHGFFEKVVVDLVGEEFM